MPFERAPCLGVVVALSFGACETPPAPRAPSVAIAPASSAPEAPAAKAADAVAPSARPAMPCPPRVSHAPLGFATERTDRKGKHGASSVAAPRFSASAPELAVSVAALQAEIDRSTQASGSRDLDAGCGPNDAGDCTINSYCDVTRNDGTLVAVLCTHEFSVSNWRSGVTHEAFLFRRNGDVYARVDLQVFAKNPKASLIARTFKATKGEDVPFDPSPGANGPFDPGGTFYATVRDTDLEVGSRIPFDTTGRSQTPLADLAGHLTCDTALDMPPARATPAQSETGALAVALHIVESEDPAITAYWFGASPTIERPRFVALEARHADAAKMLNDGLDRYFAGIQARAKAESWKVVQAFCRVGASTDKLASVFCFGGGTTEDGATRTARGSISVRLTTPPQRVEGAEIFATRAGAPAQIARHCLGAFVRKPVDTDDAVLTALPRLAPSALGDFAIARSGIFFAVEYDLAKHRQLMPCFVPHRALGTSFDALSAPR